MKRLNNNDVTLLRDYIMKNLTKQLRIKLMPIDIDKNESYCTDQLGMDLYYEVADSCYARVEDIKRIYKIYYEKNRSTTRIITQK